MMHSRTAFAFLFATGAGYACLAPHYGIDPRLDDDEAAAGSAASPTAGTATDAGSTGAGAGAAGGAGGAGEVGGGPPDDGPPVIVEGNGCEVAEAYGCKGTAQPGRLICQGGIWTSTDDCEADHNCEQASGECLPVVEACLGAAGGKRICSDGDVSECGADLVTTTVIEPCTGTCEELGETAECVPPGCGDGSQEEPEQCDDGDEDDTDECTTACKDARCGDTLIWAGHETCDDGNQVKEVCEYGAPSCTVCDAYCQEVAGTISYCGDGKHQAAAEQCDQTVASTAHTCNSQCEDTTWALWQLPPVSPSGFGWGADYVLDFTTNLEWEREASATLRNWEDAKKYCEDLELKNQTDWRLPTRMELMSLVDYGKTTPPLIDADFINAPADTFWTSFSLPGNDTVAYYVHFGTGSIGVFQKTVTTRVRCVRS